MKPRPEPPLVKGPARGTPDRYAVRGSCQPPATLPTRLGDPSSAFRAGLRGHGPRGRPDRAGGLRRSESSLLWRPVLTPRKHAPPVLTKPVHVLHGLPSREGPGQGTRPSKPSTGGHAVTSS